MREVLVGIVALAVVLGISFFWGWRTCAKNQEGKITEESVTEGAYMVFGQKILFTTDKAVFTYI